jgi:flagellar basal body rod protein FlgC
MAKRDPFLGEIRNPDQLQKIPFDRSVRVVYMVDEDGPVIRWVDPTHPKAQSLGFLYHDDLSNVDGTDLSSGWLRRHANGELEVHK